MSDITLGIIGGGQLGSMLAISAKKLNIKTIIYSDDPDAPAQNFCNKFISGDYNNKEKIIEFVNLVNYVTYEFENIPFETLSEINKLKPVLPKPSSQPKHEFSGAAVKEHCRRCTDWIPA